MRQLSMRGTSLFLTLLGADTFQETPFSADDRYPAT